MTIGEWIREIAAQLSNAGVYFGHGTSSPQDEAAWLVLHVAGEPCDGSFSDWGRAVGSSESERIRGLLQRRIDERIPLAYLLGEAWFCGLRFTVNDSVLVPRSPLAELIARGFRPWVEPDRLGRVLDLCTGSGCIAVAIAHRLAHVWVDAVDISPAALDIAAGNVSAHGLGDRVEVLRSDLFERLGGRQYDLVVSNPPYVPDGGIESLPAEYRAEPSMGLAAGPDGLDLVLAILLRAPGHLTANGVLICEVGESAERLQALLGNIPFIWLEFEHGGDGVFTIGRNELLHARPEIQAAMDVR